MGPDGVTVVGFCLLAAVILIVAWLVFPAFTSGLAIGAVLSWVILRALNAAPLEEADADDRS